MWIDRVCENQQDVAVGHGWSWHPPPPNHGFGGHPPQKRGNLFIYCVRNLGNSEHVVFWIFLVARSRVCVFFQPSLDQMRAEG